MNLFKPGELIAPTEGLGIYQYIGPDPIYPDYHNVLQLRTHQGDWRIETPRLEIGVGVTFLATMKPVPVVR